MSPSSHASPDRARERIATVEHWYHRIEVAPGIVTPGINDSPGSLALLPLPEDCSGLRVLDIGARDGFFSFEAERRGAEVLAMDYMPAEQTGFAVARELLGSNVEYVVDNVYALSEERYGRFDVVLFLGVLYHLRNPLLALDRIWSVCGDQLIMETAVLDNALLGADGKFHSLGEAAPGAHSVPLAQFYPADTLNGDFTNWWSPNMACLRGLLESACFDVIDTTLHGARGIAHARRSEDPQRLYWRRLDSSASVELAS